MQLPRRVPWAAISELEQICSWIYTDENDLDSKRLAINRLSAWRAITYLPHALESALSLLVVIVQDSTQAASSSHLSLRQSYSTAIIRLVNGLVDPLQLGAYARSIASIAHQLGLPPWLVELRHAATHEDMPSIELLREAARESMVWLLHNYFLPTINPSTVPETRAPLRSLEPVLKQYKTLLKITTRDASLKTQYKPAILSVMKDVERWIAEARVAANMTTRQLGWEANTSEIPGDSEAMDPKERWALERLCDALLEKGALVPLSRKKREFPADNFSPPTFSVLLWTPLLHHLQDLHSDFLAILSGRIMSVLAAENAPTDGTSDPSYDSCLARWALWCIRAWEEDESQMFDLRKELTVTLLQSLGHVGPTSRGSRKAATALLESLCAGNPQLEAALATLKTLSNAGSLTEWNPEDMIIMDQRLNTLLSSSATSRSSKPWTDSPAEPIGAPTSETLPGWRLLGESSGWRPCPIGVHCATI
ncbi:putative las1-like [Lyophyllum shimeji]|uniref:Las1-like n=1 Tax=Lyophyllum shimeji TaxID=47721 RepID=A0A9P3UKL2_LYOSH|nr:putative las1-like [Lyophyllum shimeji]